MRRERRKGQGQEKKERKVEECRLNQERLERGEEAGKRGREKQLGEELGKREVRRSNRRE